MESLEITQRLLAIGDTYEVRDKGSEAVVATVHGKVSISPRLTLSEGENGKELGRVTGNALNTSFEIVAGDARAELSFPAIEMKKSFSLSYRGKQYKADGGFSGAMFACKAATGELLFSMEKLSSLRSRFEVKLGEDVPRDVALLAAIAVHQAHF